MQEALPPCPILFRDIRSISRISYFVSGFVEVEDELTLEAVFVLRPTFGNTDSLTLHYKAFKGERGDATPGFEPRTFSVYWRYVNSCKRFMSFLSCFIAYSVRS